jgi:hypothetical protein
VETEAVVLETLVKIAVRASVVKKITEKKTSMVKKRHQMKKVPLKLV